MKYFLLALVASCLPSGRAQDDYDAAPIPQGGSQLEASSDLNRIKFSISVAGSDTKKVEGHCFHSGPTGVMAEVTAKNPRNIVVWVSRCSAR